METLHPGGPELTRRAIEACSPVPGMRVVDIGCGRGAALQTLAQEYGLQPVGFDLDFETVRAGLACLAERSMGCARAQALPLAAASCDIVLAECSLAAMDDLDAALAECWRVLVPGGMLAISDLYRRAAGGAAPLPDRQGWMDRLRAARLEPQTWEDHTPALKIMAAQAIFSGRPLESLWGCCPARPIDPTDLKSLGYFLCIAEKQRW